MSNIKYDDTDYLINREESIEYKISDTNVGSIGEDKERLMKSLNYELDKIMTRSSKVENATEILNLRQPITYMFLNLLEELEQKDKKIKELEEENKIYVLNGDNVNLEIYIKNNYIPVQKVKDLEKKIINCKIARAYSNGYYYDRLLNQEYIEVFRNLFKKLLEDK